LINVYVIKIPIFLKRGGSRSESGCLDYKI